MQIWLHTRTPETGDALGFVEVRPNSAALELIAGGFADPINKGSLTKLAPEAKWDGTSALVLAFDGPPSVEVDPAISGHNAPGSVLECTPGSYFGHPIPTIARQWLRNGADIVGETGLEYTVVTGDHDAGISIRETVANEFGSVQAVSNVITIIPADFTPTGWLTTGQDANGNIGMGNGLAGGSFTGNLMGMVPTAFYTAATFDGILIAPGGSGYPTVDTILTLEWNGDIVFTSDTILPSAWSTFMVIPASGFKFVAGRVYGCSLTPAFVPPGTGEITTAAEGSALLFIQTPGVGFGVTSSGAAADFGSGSGTFAGAAVGTFFTGRDVDGLYLIPAVAAQPAQLNVRVYDSSGTVIASLTGGLWLNFSYLAWNSGVNFKFVAGQTYYFESF